MCRIGFLQFLDKKLHEDTKALAQKELQNEAYYMEITNNYINT